MLRHFILSFELCFTHTESASSGVSSLDLSPQQEETQHLTSPIMLMEMQAASSPDPSTSTLGPDHTQVSLHFLSLEPTLQHKTHLFVLAVDSPSSAGCLCEMPFSPSNQTHILLLLFAHRQRRFSEEIASPASDVSCTPNRVSRPQ